MAAGAQAAAVIGSNTVLRGTPVPTYIDRYDSTSDLTAYSFSVTQPTSGAMLLAFVARNGSPTADIASVTVGGLPARVAVSHNGATGTVVGVAAIESVPAGSHTVVVTFSEGMLRCVLWAWQCANLFSVVPYGAAVNQGTALATSIAAAVNIDRPSVSIFVAGSSAASNAITMSGTGVTNRENVTNFEGMGACAGEAVTAGSGASTLTGTASIGGGGGSNNVFAAASF